MQTRYFKTHKNTSSLVERKNVQYGRIAYVYTADIIRPDIFRCFRKTSFCSLFGSCCCCFFFSFLDSTQIHKYRDANVVLNNSTLHYNTIGVSREEIFTGEKSSIASYIISMVKHYGVSIHVSKSSAVLSFIHDIVSKHRSSRTSKMTNI